MGTITSRQLQEITKPHRHGTYGSGNQPGINMWKEELGIIVEAASINADSLYKGKKKIPQTNENNTKQQF